MTQSAPMTIRRLRWALGAALALTACDSAKGDEDTTEAETSPEEAEAPTKAAAEKAAPMHKASGLWRGTFKSPRWTGTVIGLVTQDGSARFVSSGGAQFVGTFDDDAKVATKMDGFVNRAKAGSYDVDAQATPKASLVGKYNSPSDSGSFDLRYVGDYERSISVADLKGSWGGSGFAMEVDDAGKLEGKDSSGCAYTGTLAQVDPRYAAFDVKVTAEGCAHAGSYDGLVAVTKKDLPTEVMAYAISGDTRGTQGFLARGGSIGSRAALDAIAAAGKAVDAAGKAVDDAGEAVDAAGKAVDAAGKAVDGAAKGNEGLKNGNEGLKKGMEGLKKGLGL